MKLTDLVTAQDIARQALTYKADEADMQERTDRLQPLLRRFMDCVVALGIAPHETLAIYACLGATLLMLDVTLDNKYKTEGQRIN